MHDDQKGKKRDADGEIICVLSLNIIKVQMEGISHAAGIRFFVLVLT